MVVNIEETVINKIKYYIYSRRYKKIYSSKGIKNITNANYVYLGRQNGKTIMSFKDEVVSFKTRINNILNKLK